MILPTRFGLYRLFLVPLLGKENSIGLNHRLLPLVQVGELPRDRYHIRACIFVTRLVLLLGGLGKDRTH